MQSWKFVALAAAILSEGLVEAKDICKSTKTVTTTPTGIIACPACILPTTTCKPDEPSLKPFPSITSSCTVSVLHECPCTTCLTTTAAPTSTKSDDHGECATTATVTKPAEIQCLIACVTPTESVCKPGEPTGPPQYDVTTKHCTVTSSKKSCPGCASCVLPTTTAAPTTSTKSDDHGECATTATITKPAEIQCLIACIAPTESVCKPGESTGPPQYDVTTKHCTVTSSKKSCPGCASCVLATPTPRALI